MIDANVLDEFNEVIERIQKKIKKKKEQNSSTEKKD